jgi:hypothetical protein
MIRLSVTKKEHYISRIKELLDNYEGKEVEGFLSRKNKYRELFSSPSIYFYDQFFTRESKIKLDQGLENLIGEIKKSSDINIDLDAHFLHLLEDFFKNNELLDDQKRMPYSYDQMFWEYINLTVCLKFILLRWTLKDKKISWEQFSKSTLKYLSGYTRNYSFSLWRMYLICNSDLDILRFYGRDGQQSFIERINTKNDVGYSEELYRHILVQYFNRTSEYREKADSKYVRLLAKLNNAYLHTISAEHFRCEGDVSTNIRSYVNFLFTKADQLTSKWS